MIYKCGCGTGPLRIPQGNLGLLVDVTCQSCGKILKPRAEPSIIKQQHWDFEPEWPNKEKRISNVKGARKIKTVAKGLGIPDGDAADILMFEEKQKAGG